MRTPLAVVGSAALAALGGAILGEYTLNGALAVVGALLYGLVVAEVVVGVERRPSAVGSAVATVFPPIGWVWSLWISNGHHLHFATGVQWASALVSAVAGLAWTVTGRRVVDRVGAPSATVAGPDGDRAARPGDAAGGVTEPVDDPPGGGESS